MSHELYKRYRPKNFKQLVGQAEAVSCLTKMVGDGGIDHALLFTGPSGCGKTMIARILQKKLNCAKHDFDEKNCADFRGIDMVREIRQNMGLSPIAGDCRIYLIDECHQLSKDAQNAILKMLEDPPAHVYFMLATTEPQKLLRTIHTRCTEIRVRSLTSSEMIGLVQQVVEKEGGKELSDEVMEKLVDAAEGSPRKALVLLGQIIGVDNDEDQLSAINNADGRRQGIEIARMLLNPRTQWADMAKLLREVDEEPESLRHMILSYANNVLLGGGKMAARASLLIVAFERNFYDSKKAGLTQACYEVISAK